MHRLSLTLAACGCAMGAAASAPDQRYDPRMGQKHPDFMLPVIGTRKPVALSQLQGRKTLLIHFASW